MATESLIANIEKLLFSEHGANVYTVLDGASVPDLPQKLWEMKPEHVCLYRGKLEPDMAEVAPYLVKLEPGGKFTTLVLKEGWGQHWGIFAVTPADLRTTRKHFRKFLMALDPDNKSIYFRYYDPRVLRVYLPTCEDEEMDILFGPILFYAMEAEEPETLLRTRPGADAPRTESIALTQPGIPVQR